MEHNADLFAVVRNKLSFFCGEHPQKRDLLVVGYHLCTLLHIAFDRLAKRSIDCLLCWFCEHWGAIEPSLMLLPRQGYRSYDTRPLVPVQPAPATPLTPDTPASLPFSLDDFDFPDPDIFGM
jgi:hypothetical protein